MKQHVIIAILILLGSTLCGVEVGGHIWRNTTWTPDNNPYIITSFLYIDAGVTLTIMPGTQIRCTGADKSSIYNFMWSGNTQPLSKMIIVNGAINAVGTSDNPITFDKYQPDTDYRWGGIYMYPNAPISTFEFCELRNTFFCDYVPGEWSLAAIDFDNGVINIRSCTFENNLNAIRTGFLQDDILIYDCRFISINDIYPTPFGMTGFIGFSAAPEPEPENHYKVTIAKCYFAGSAGLGPVGYYMDILYLNNVADNFIGRSERSGDYRSEFGSVSSYGNLLNNGKGGWGCRSATETDTVYARRNTLIKPLDVDPGFEPLYLSSNGFGTNYVSDNYLFGRVRVHTQQSNATTSYIYNNIIENTNSASVLEFDVINPNYQGGQVRFFNNLVRNLGSIETYAVNVQDNSPSVYNNTILGYHTLHFSRGDYHTNYTNNIIDITYGFGQFDYGFYPLLYNNCLSIPIPQDSSIVGECNIVADPMFADTLNADYTLSADSPCIDVGALRPDLPAFDLRYHERISVSGARAVDIGAYEYDSVYIGGIAGFVYDSASGAPVDCVKIEISGKLPEFSDSLGVFPYPSGAGVFDVKASRWDYEDLVIPNVVVNRGEDTILQIPLVRTTVNNEDTSQVAPTLAFALVNFPNPFNPITTISFIAPESAPLCLSIYNLKGQKVRTLLQGDISQGHHTVIWDGTDAQSHPVSSGIYFARIEQGKRHQTHKLILMK